MAGRKSMANMLETTLYASPSTSSPIRRRSIVPQRDPLSALSQNDDEAERFARRREVNITSTPVSANQVDRRRSLGLGFLDNMPQSQIAERITQCVKLGSENKINQRNAFSLQIIDFMTYMIKKRDVNMSNLQVASTSLDVSTKIYGFRVDGVHADILKMIGGLDQQEKVNTSSNTNETGEQVVSEEGGQVRKVKRKRKNKQKIYVSMESLKTNVETLKPSVATIEEADSQTTDTLFQAMLPNHANSRFYLHPYNDILVDTLKSNVSHDIDTRITLPKLDNFSQMEICPPLCNFDFLNWNSDESLIVDPPPSQNRTQNEFQFDIDASLPSDDEARVDHRNYFDLMDGDSQEENVERCVRAPNVVENITDFREVVTTAKPTNVLEYSFIQQGLNLHWAGHSHWKASNFRKPPNISNNMVETCRQGPIRRRKQIDMKFNSDVRKRVIDSFVNRPSAKVNSRTTKQWNEEILTLPPDEHYNIKRMNKVFFHLVIGPCKDKDKRCDEHLSDAADPCDFANENDLSNDAPVFNNDINQQSTQYNSYGNDNANRFEDCNGFNSQIPYTGQNLVAAPKLTCKSMIAYSTRAKNIDMRQLKKCIWKSLGSSSERRDTSISEHENQSKGKPIDNKRFSEIYKKLPTMLSEKNAEALSFPISFVSLLHLANEKTLKITSTPDLADLIVTND